MCQTPWSVFQDGSDPTISPGSRACRWKPTADASTGAPATLCVPRDQQHRATGATTQKGAHLEKTSDHPTVWQAGYNEGCTCTRRQPPSYLLSPRDEPILTIQAPQDRPHYFHAGTGLTVPEPAVPQRNPKDDASTHWLDSLLLQRFQALFNSLFKVLFIFPSRYLFAIGLSEVFSFR